MAAEGTNVSLKFAQLKKIDFNMRKVYFQVSITAAAARRVGVELTLKDYLGAHVGFGALTSEGERSLIDISEDGSPVTFAIDIGSLAAGTYACDLAVTRPYVEVLDNFKDFLSFDITKANTNNGIGLEQSWGRGSVVIPLQLISALEYDHLR